MRFLILILLGYLIYRVLRGFQKTGRTERRGPEEGPEGPIDEMVQDPVCKTYIPMREAEKRIIGGRTYYFCSKACSEKFQRQSKAQDGNR